MFRALCYTNCSNQNFKKEIPYLSLYSMKIYQTFAREVPGLLGLKYETHYQKNVNLLNLYLHAKFYQNLVWICAYEEVRMFVFRKIRCTLFSWNTRLEIRPFTLLPQTNCALSSSPYLGKITIMIIIKWNREGIFKEVWK